MVSKPGAQQLQDMLLHPASLLCESRQFLALFRGGERSALYLQLHTEMPSLVVLKESYLPAPSLSSYSPLGSLIFVEESNR